MWGGKRRERNIKGNTLALSERLQEGEKVRQGMRGKVWKDELEANATAGQGQGPGPF